MANVGGRNRPAARARRGGVARTAARSPQAATATDRWLALLAGAGGLLSGYLFITKIQKASTFCLWGSGCDTVQASRFGAVFGIPVSAFGLLFYGILLLVALRPMTARARWSWMLPVASGGVAASAVFVAVQQFVIRATCRLCLISAALSVVILILALARRPQAAPPRAWLWSGAAALAAVLFLAGGYASSAPQPAATDYAEGLARHLAATGVRLYGAYWCPHCQDQKALFGRAARSLPYIECDARGVGGKPQLCAEAGIRAYPTWDINGQHYEGVLPLDELARLTGYPPPAGP